MKNCKNCRQLEERHEKSIINFETLYVCGEKLRENRPRMQIDIICIKNPLTKRCDKWEQEK